jgi:hypothetical protein
VQQQLHQFPPSQQFYQHAHPAPDAPHSLANGAYPDTRSQSSVYTNGSTLNGSADDMQPYPYQTGYPNQNPAYQQQPQQPSPQQYQPYQYQQQMQPHPQNPMHAQLPPPTQLPPMQMQAPPMYSGATAPPFTHAGPVPGLPPPPFHPGAAMPHQMGTAAAYEQPPARPEVKLAMTGQDERGYTYTLMVDQQPQRARMCGFGDKDRRPITPPPCIRLVIKDKSGKEVGIDDVDGQYFVLQVDLWDENGMKEVNIVRASSSTPSMSISNSTTTSYPPQPERPVLGMAWGGHYTPDGQPTYGLYPRNDVPPQMNYAGPHSSPMFTRNLIGSLTVNASRLKDPEGKEGYWFVLQDLSVRTEGFFR